jgi:hypothetical protein
VIRVLLVSLLLAMVPAAGPYDWIRADDAIRIEDAFKWIYQATQGGEHAAPSRDGAGRWLDEEWNALGAPQPGEPLVQPLGDSGIVRLNLRPYRARGGTRDAILDAFIASANEFSPKPDVFAREWEALGAALKTGPIGALTRADWEGLDAKARPRGYPAVHHSDHYNDARHPAYRILTAKQADALLKRLP